MPTAGLLVIGNEILSGKIVDTNSPYLARELRELGVDLERILTIPDEIDLIAREARTMSDAYDYVFTSGGIGPTHDDVTMEAIASAFGRKIVLSEALCSRIQRAQGGKELNESQRKMALLPEGAETVDAGDLWFPVVIVENVHIFPGIPKLLQTKFHAIRERFSGVPFKLVRIYVKRHESDIAESLNDLLHEYSELMLGSYPKISEPEYRVLLTLESRDEVYLKRATDALLSRLSPDDIHKVE
jgi:molybdenum cofactor synthesis domain-containing protein